MPNYFNSDSPKMWYLEKDETQMLTKLNSYIKQLQSNPRQKDLTEDWKILERQYGVKYNVSQTQDLFSDKSTVQRVKLNVIKSVIDTTYNKVGKNKPLPYFLTNGGNFDQQEKSKNLSKFIEGCFYENNVYDIGRDLLRDALLYGTAVVKNFVDNNKFKFERRKPSNILIDMEEAVFINPSQYHEIDRLSRQTLVEMYPKFKEEIMLADTAKLEETDPFENDQQKDNSIVEVCESWVLAEKFSEDNIQKGIHTISINSAILLKEEYGKCEPPFTFFKWDKPLLGFWGTGMAEAIQSIQIEINKVLRTLQLSIHLTAIPKVFLQRGTTVPRSHFNNEIGGLIIYDGVEPKYASVGSVPPELMQYLQWLIDQLYQMTGVSVLSAQSLKPSGLNSGKALNTFNDIESERFITYGQKYEELFLDLAKKCIEMASDLEEEGIDVITKAHGDVSFEKMKWSDVKLSEDSYVMKAYPISFFSTTPSAKWQEVQELINAGMLDPKTGMKLLDFPDLKAVSKSVTGQEYAIDQIISGFVRGEYESPDAYINLELAQQKIQDAYADYKTQKLNESKLQLFRDFLDEIAIIKNMQAQQMEAQADLMAVEQATPVDPLEGAGEVTQEELTSDMLDPNYMGE